MLEYDIEYVIVRGGCLDAVGVSAQAFGHSMTSAFCRRLSGARPASCLIRLLFGALQHEGGLNERDPAVLRLHEILRHKHTVRCAPQGRAAPPRTEPVLGQAPGRSPARRGRGAAKRRPAGKRTQHKMFSGTGLGLSSWGALIAIRSRSGGWGGGRRQGGDAHVLPYLHQAPDPSATRGGRSGRGFSGLWARRVLADDVGGGDAGALHCISQHRKVSCAGPSAATFS